MKPSNLSVSKRAILSWCFYDWAIGPYSVLIITFIFSTYFTEKVAINKIIGTSQWGKTAGLAGLIVAILSPILGAIADHQGPRKPWLLVLTPLLIIASAALWFIQPSPNFVYPALFWVVIGIMAHEISIIFYNAMLKELSPPGFLGRFSGWGWGFGYLGGVIALIIALYFFIFHGETWFNLNPEMAEQVRICGPLVAVWTLVFALPLFIFTPDLPSKHVGFAEAVRKGIRSLGHTLRLLSSKYRPILLFLISRMLYIDGMTTIFAFGGIYAAGVLHMSIAEVIEFGIGMNLAAGLGAAVFGWLDDAQGPKLTILFSLGLMVFFGISLLLVHSKLLFWSLGMCFSLGVGPAQAASRSLLIRIAPSNLITELFGLYNFSGKATTFLGPWILALVTHHYSSQRWGMSTAFIFMIAGGILLYFVKNGNGQR